MITLAKGGVKFNAVASRLLNLNVNDRLSFEYEDNTLYMRFDPKNGIKVNYYPKSLKYLIHRTTLRQKIQQITGIKKGVLIIGEFSDGRYPLQAVERSNPTQN